MTCDWCEEPIDPIEGLAWAGMCDGCWKVAYMHADGPGSRGPVACDLLGYRIGNYPVTMDEADTE